MVTLIAHKPQGIYHHLSHIQGIDFTFLLFRLTFWIPSNASSLWLHSIGKIPGLTSGQLTAFLNPDATQTEYLISVTVTYGLKDYGARNSTAICLLQSGQTEWGVGFYVSYSLFLSLVSCSNVSIAFFLKLLGYEPSIPNHHIHATNRRQDIHALSVPNQFTRISTLIPKPTRVYCD